MLGSIVERVEEAGSDRSVVHAVEEHDLGPLRGTKDDMTPAGHGGLSRSTGSTMTFHGSIPCVMCIGTPIALGGRPGCHRFIRISFHCIDSKNECFFEQKTRCCSN